MEVSGFRDFRAESLNIFVHLAIVKVPLCSHSTSLEWQAPKCHLNKACENPGALQYLSGLVIMPHCHTFVQASQACKLHDSPCLERDSPYPKR